MAERRSRNPFSRQSATDTAPSGIVPENEENEMTTLDETVETSTEDASTTNGSAPDLNKLQTGVGFTASLAFRMAIEEAAANQKLPVGTFVRNLVANQIGFALPAEKTSSRGMTDEEKKAKYEADKAKSKEERAAVAAQLKAQREARAQAAKAASTPEA